MAKQLQQSIFAGAPDWVRWASADSFGWLYWTAENPKALTGEIQLIPGQDLRQEVANQWAGCEPLQRVQQGLPKSVLDYAHRLLESPLAYAMRGNFKTGGVVPTASRSVKGLENDQINMYAHGLAMADIDRMCEAFKVPKPSTVETLEVMKESVEQIGRMLAHVIAEIKSK